jgi:hypothetical protein
VKLVKFLVAGAWQWSWYQEAFSKALATLGHEVKRFGWAEYFFRDLGNETAVAPKNFWCRVQNRLIAGPLVTRLNDQLVRDAADFAPDVVFAYNATHLLPSTLRRIKRTRPKTLLVQYSNDNPFSRRADALLWRHLKRGIALYDAHFVYRHSNRADFERHGGRNVHLLRSYYIPETDFRRELEPGDEHLSSDVAFVGHYEPDGRLPLLEAVARLDVKFKLFGSTWYLAEKELHPASPLRPFFPVKPLFRADYRKAISGTKIALSFLSKLNGDTYTRRSFEIPAVKTFMLSEHSPDLESLFEEGKEAEFFRSKAELLDKVLYYAKHDDEREAIARRGHERLLRDGHDVVSRAKRAVELLETLR